MRHRIASLVENALHAAASAGELLSSPLPAVIIGKPANPEHGDFSCNAAMQLAKAERKAPRQVAEIILRHIGDGNGLLSKTDIAGPGFINVTLTAGAAGELARTIVVEGAEFGRSDVNAGERINVEFISANPTGPLHLGHTRWAAVGDAIARVLEASGATVAREFYVNDRGVQMEKFGASIMAVATGAPIPEDGYHGEYIRDLAVQILAEQPEITALPADEQHAAFREAGYRLQLAQQQDVLENFNTHFDVWFSERSLHDSRAVELAFKQLDAQGHMFEEEGAVWLRTTDFDDDKDRVLRKSDGELTYFASDTAYYVDKRMRGFDRCIYLLGADHHGYVNRLRAIASCAGDNPDQNIEILIGQLVKMMKGGEEVRLSKRAGNIITLEDLVDEVGVDAARYSLIRFPVDSPLVLDLDLLIRRTNDNPVFYVQYAHARISSVLRNAAEMDIDWRATAFDPAQLVHEKELELLGALGEFARTIATAAELREPHRVARYLEDLATFYHRFYDNCRVLPRDDEVADELTIARLWLCAATRQVLANGLDLCGVSAPERM